MNVGSYMLRLRDSCCLSIIVLCLGCGGTVGTVGGGYPSPTTVTAANTLIWVTQLQNQAYTAQCPSATACSPTNDVASGATDAEGNIFIGGQTASVLPGNVSDGFNQGAFVAKLDPDGGVSWTRQFGPASDVGFAVTTSIQTDAQGNVYAGGYTTGAFTGYTNSERALNLFLAKLDAAGDLLWVQQYNPQLPLLLISGECIALLPTGSVAFGWLSGSSTEGSGFQSFVYVVDPTSGTKLWQQSYPGNNYLQALIADQQGNLIATGISIGPFPGDQTSSVTVPFVIKINGQNGTLNWQQTFGSYQGPSNPILSYQAMAIDPSGDVVLGGASAFSGQALCAGLCTTPIEFPQAAEVAKLSGTSGGIEWAKRFSTSSGDGITGIAVNSVHDVYATGFTHGVFASVFTQPVDDLFVLKLDANGSPIWVQQFGTGPWLSGAPPSNGPQAVIDPSGNIFVTSSTQGAFPGAQNPAGLGEAFVTKFGP